MTYGETAAFLDRYQPAAMACLRRAITRGRLPHGIVLSSPGNVGEIELARLLAARLLCKDPAGPLEPCGSCASCRASEHDRHPDMHDVAPKGLSRSIRTEDMLALIQAFQQTSMLGGAKIGIIHQTETLRKESANRFLKTLEEPTPNTYFFLVTTRIERLLPTIKSRCQVIRLTPLAPEVLRARVQSELGLSGDDLSLTAAIARGRWNRAVHLRNHVHEYRDETRQLASMLADRTDTAADAVAYGKAMAQSFKAGRAAFEDQCKGELAARTKELADVETGVRRAVLDELEDELKSAQAATERDDKASLFESMIDLWRDVWVFKLTRSPHALLHPYLQPVIEKLADAYAESEIVRNLADIDLVRGPTVYLNARIDLVLQGLLAQATMKPEALVPLRCAIKATGL